METQRSIELILKDAKQIAQEYYRLTGKPLGITGEVAEYEAARILGVELAPVRQSGFDAIETLNGVERRLQIKGRCIPSGANRSQRLGSIDISKGFDAVLLILLDREFNAFEIWEAERPGIVDALTAPGSRSRNERNAMSMRLFMSIGRLRWRTDTTAMF